MKFYIAERDGAYLKVCPTGNYENEDTHPDAWLDFMVYNERFDEGALVQVLAIELYAFMDWLVSWCPDPRKESVVVEATPARPLPDASVLS